MIWFSDWVPKCPGPIPGAARLVGVVGLIRLVGVSSVSPGKAEETPRQELTRPIAHFDKPYGTITIQLGIGSAMVIVTGLLH